jgi:secondary thiamine-phosphate synthase enzyme
MGGGGVPMQETIRIASRKEQEVLDITREVGEVVARAGVAEGVCTVFVRHSTAAIIVNENADPGFRADVVTALERLFPPGIWEHDKVDDNGAAHLKAMVLGPSESVPVHAGRLRLGTWQGLALVECDGPREREIVVDVR